MITLSVIGIGLYFNNNGDPVLGNKLVGFSTAFLFLIVMPAFIVVRYRKKDLSEFNFNSKSEEEETEEDDWEDKSRWN